MLQNTEPNLDVNFKTAAITNGSGSSICCANRRHKPFQPRDSELKILTFLSVCWLKRHPYHLANSLANVGLDHSGEVYETTAPCSLPRYTRNRCILIGF